jgi:formylglycine-generating enzyme required for sulfatase activity
MGSLDYSWTASDPAAEFYTLYYVEGTVTEAAEIIRGTELPWVASGGTIDGLKPSTVYSALLRAWKSNYNPADSGAAQGTSFGLPALSTPVLNVTPGSGSLSFTWAPTTPPATYTLYYRLGVYTEPADVKEGTAVNASTNVARTITNLTPGATYSALLVAAQTNYTSSESAVVQGTVPPNPPVLIITAGADSLTYSWTDSAPAAESYDVYYVSGIETNPETVKAGTKITGATSGNAISSLSAGDTYSFLVTANITGYDPVDSGVSRGTVESAPSGDTRSKTFSGVALNFRYVPSGSFQYKSGAANIATITRGYWLGETEVTQELFQAVMGTNPSHFDGTAGKEAAGGETQNQRPVEKVSFYAAIAFCNKLSLLDGKDPVYSVTGVSDWSTVAIPTADDADWDAAAQDYSKSGYRLPAYLEWMWAAMGADKSVQPNTAGYAKAFAGSTGTNDVNDYAWHSGNSGTKTHEVAKKSPNELGLYDMSGNVNELFTSRGVPTGAQTDYMGTLTGTQSSFGGGDWKYASSYCRFTVTYSINKYLSSDNAVGFRVLCPQKP